MSLVAYVARMERLTVPETVAAARPEAFERGLVAKVQKRVERTLSLVRWKMGVIWSSKDREKVIVRAAVGQIVGPLPASSGAQSAAEGAYVRRRGCSVCWAGYSNSP